MKFSQGQFFKILIEISCCCVKYSLSRKINLFLLRFSSFKSIFIVYLRDHICRICDIFPRLHEIFNDSFSENFNEIFMETRFREIFHHYLCVCLSLAACAHYCKTPILCQNDGTYSTVQFVLSDSKMCLFL